MPNDTTSTPDMSSKIERLGNELALYFNANRHDPLVDHANKRYCLELKLLRMADGTDEQHLALLATWVAKVHGRADLRTVQS